MKKLIAPVLSLVLALSLSATALAVQITEKDGNPAEAAAEITTFIAPTYTVTIPEDVKVTFNETSTAFGSIELTAAQIDPDYAVRVTLTAGGRLVNAADESKTIAYAIRVKDTDEEFDYGEYRTDGDSTALTIDITRDAWDAAYAGSYSDAVIFTISYERSGAVNQ